MIFFFAIHSWALRLFPIHIFANQRLLNLKSFRKIENRINASALSHSNYFSHFSIEHRIEHFCLLLFLDRCLTPLLLLQLVLFSVGFGLVWDFFLILSLIPTRNIHFKRCNKFTIEKWKFMQMTHRVTANAFRIKCNILKAYCRARYSQRINGLTTTNAS